MSSFYYIKLILNTLEFEFKSKKKIEVIKQYTELSELVEQARKGVDKINE